MGKPPGGNGDSLVARGGGTLLRRVSTAVRIVPAKVDASEESGGCSADAMRTGFGLAMLSRDVAAFVLGEHLRGNRHAI